nr:MAG TPA: hypothetical protein [Caudoviricetes sp.]
MKICNFSICIPPSHFKIAFIFSVPRDTIFYYRKGVKKCF